MPDPVTPAPGALPPRTRRSAPKERKSRPVLWTFLWILILAAMGGAFYVGYLYYKVDTAIQSAGTPVVVPPAQSAKVKPLTILLLGKDTRKETGSMNTDVIMAASLNPATRSATLVSIPRDTLVKVNGFRSGKANSYYANFYAANKVKANANTKELFGNYLGVPVDYLAIVDFQGFVDIVDHLGGLDLDVDQNMCYRDRSDGTDIRLTKGPQHLNGDKTLDFVRYRHSNCNPPTAESGDLDRNKRQQQVIGELVGKLKSPSILTKLGAMIESVGNNLETDIPSSQIRQLLQTYMGIDRDNINYIHLEGTWKSPYINVEPDVLNQAREALKRQISE